MNTTATRTAARTLPASILAPAPVAPAPQPADWRGHLPRLDAGIATLRELETSDAASLFEALSSEEVTRFISPPPSTIDGFERFIEWTRHEQANGRYICYGIVPEGEDRVVGIIQVRQLDPGFGNAEWGFALGSDYWGTGLFHASAMAVIGFAFEHVGVHRLEARAAVANGRGNAALRKLGATEEGVLRRSFVRHGRHHDQVLWGLVATDWIYFQAGLPAHVH